MLFACVFVVPPLKTHAKTVSRIFTFLKTHVFDNKNSDEMNIAREQWIEFTKADIRAKYWSQETGVWSLKREN